MKVAELADKLHLECLTKEGDLNRDVTGCYIGDLLSWVMGRAMEGDAWITVMSNVNIIAVATLSNVSCIILAESVTPDPAVLEKAEAQEINVLRSTLSSFEIAKQISEVAGL
ncbi:MAG: hypothetical protein II351_00190 [Clostridia bacterium]|nr:hypothetical protein [Clostridia bacterium]